MIHSLLWEECDRGCVAIAPQPAIAVQPLIADRSLPRQANVWHSSVLGELHVEQRPCTRHPAAEIAIRHTSPVVSLVRNTLAVKTPSASLLQFKMASRKGGSGIYDADDIEDGGCCRRPIALLRARRVE